MLYWLQKEPSSLVNCSTTVSFSTDDLYLYSFSLDVSLWSVLWRHLGSLQQPWDAQGVHCCVWPERWCLLELKHSRKEGDWATLYNANQECFPEVQGAFLGADIIPCEDGRNYTHDTKAQWKRRWLSNIV